MDQRGRWFEALDQGTAAAATDSPQARPVAGTDTAASMNRVAVAACIRPRKLAARYDRTPEQLWISYRHRNYGMGGFLLFWLIGWTVGCVFLTREALVQRTAEMILFALPFWTAWFFVVAMIAHQFFALEQFLLDASGVAYRWRVFITLTTRVVPLDEIDDFRELRVFDSEGSQYSAKIEMRTMGQPLRFAADLRESERNWLIQELNAHRAALGQTAQHEAALGQTAQHEAAALRGVAAMQTSAGASSPSSGESFAAKSDGLANVETGPARPPSDCRWRMLDDVADVVLEQHGRRNWGMLAGLLFLNAFFNGIVGLFVVCLGGGIGGPPQFGIQWWGLFVFLIPFEVIGLAMLAALMIEVLEPVRRTTWRISGDAAQCRRAWFRIGHRTIFSLDGLARLEVRAEPARLHKLRTRIRFADESCVEGDQTYELVFVSHNDNELCAIVKLTRGEALWMNAVVLRRRPEWFTET